MIEVNKAQALEFMHILNSFQPFVPPFLYQKLNGHPVLLNLSRVEQPQPQSNAKAEEMAARIRESMKDPRKPNGKSAPLSNRT